MRKVRFSFTVYGRPHSGFLITAWLENSTRRVVGSLGGRYIYAKSRVFIESLKVGRQFQPRLEFELLERIEEEARKRQIREVQMDADPRLRLVLVQRGYEVVREPYGKRDTTRLKKHLPPKKED